jgi:hypothetical protein
MSGASSLDGTRNRIAAGSSLVAGALVMYWLLEILRKQVPDVGARHVKVSIASWSVLALAFGLVARRPKVSNWMTWVPLFLVAGTTPSWGSRPRIQALWRAGNRDRCGHDRTVADRRYSSRALAPRRCP